MTSLRLFLLICLFMLTACGQKGDLYFPEQKAATDATTVLESYGLF